MGTNKRENEKRGTQKNKRAMAQSAADVCHICLEGSPEIIQSGCACRGAAGLAHPACREKAATELAKRKGYTMRLTCQTCKKEFTGAMRRKLVNAWWLQVQGYAEEDTERLAAGNALATLLCYEGNSTEAERIEREVLATQTRVHGAKHPDTVTTLNNLASTLSEQGKHKAAEKIQREVLAVRGRVFGAEHPDTLSAQNNLARFLCRQGKLARAEKMQRECVGVRERVFGAEHHDTLGAKNNLARTLHKRGSYAEAEGIERKVLALRTRVQGAAHPDTLLSANNLALTLGKRGEHQEAEELERSTLKLSESVLGPQHPRTLTTAKNLAWSIRMQGKHDEAQGEQADVRSPQTSPKNATALTGVGAGKRKPSSEHGVQAADGSRADSTSNAGRVESMRARC